MISSTDLVKDYSQLNLINFEPVNNKTDDTGVTFAELLNEADKQTKQEPLSQTQKPLDKAEEEKLEDVEIEVEVDIQIDDVPDNKEKNIFAGMLLNVQKQDKKDNPAVKLINDLNNIIKKADGQTKQKPSVLNLLDEKKSQKIKIAVKSLDAPAKKQAINVLKQLKSGKIDNNVANIKLSEIVANSQIGKDIRQKNVSSEKNIKNEKNVGSVKIRAKIANNNVKPLNVLQERIPNKDIVALNKTLKTSETKLTKTWNAKDTEVNRKDEQKTKVKTAKTDNAASVSKPNVDGDKMLSTWTTELNLNTTEIKNDGSVKPDIKTVLSDNKQTIFNNLVDNTKFIQTQNMTKFTMVMRPENVGRMDFQLTVKDGKIGGKIILQTQEAADFFRSNIEEISAVFRKANVELSSLDVSLAGHNFNQSSGQFAQNSQGQGFSNQMLDSMRVTSHYNHRALNAFESNATVVSSNYGNSKINLLI